MSSHRRPDTRRLPAACPRCLRNLRLCFGAARSGISATLLGQVLCQAAGSDLIPELAGGGAPLGQIGAEAMVPPPTHCRPTDGPSGSRAAALLAAKDTVLGVLEKLAYHLAAVVGRWRGRLAGREVEPAERH
eukprot:scaffold23960_cov37-Phaeocystis_antarctica.AAC.1